MLCWLYSDGEYGAQLEYKNEGRGMIWFILWNTSTFTAVSRTDYDGQVWK